MEPESWAVADEKCDEIAGLIDGLFESDQLKPVRDKLNELNALLNKRYSLNLTCVLDVFDSEREHALPLLRTGLSTTPEGEVYRTWNDSSSQRYVVDGNMQVVPHDCCPKCWGQWDFKWMHPACEQCDAELGKNCKILLDSDVCPNCEKGKVSVVRPVCEKCGFSVDPSWVVWG
jgi:hypothetical protein